MRCNSHASVFGKCASTSARTRECTASASAHTRECSVSASAITRECTATTRLGGREQRARDSEKRARGRLGGREQRTRGSEKIARGRLGEKHGGSEKRTRIPEQRVQRSETESAEARRARAKQRNLGGRAMACLHTCRARDISTYHGARWAGELPALATNTHSRVTHTSERSSTRE